MVERCFSVFTSYFSSFYLYGFLFTSVELIEIIVDGVTGDHRFFYDKLGWLLLLINTIEILSVLAFIAALVFMARRNLLKVPRFQMSEMSG